LKINHPNGFQLLLFFIFFLMNSFVFSNASAQHQLTIKVKNNTVVNNVDSIFAAGSFNNWNPKHPSFLFTKTPDGFQLTLTDLRTEKYAFKLTRGNWGNVECRFDATDIDNREIIVLSDTSIVCEVESWKAIGTETRPVSTASPNVYLLDTAFRIPQLNRQRTIRIYLPEGYHKNQQRYPVLYMQDGQNLFDVATSGFGEWGVDETLDSLQKAKRATCIVVGIDNSSKRLTEYNPFYFERFGAGEGNAYADFIALTLKPYIDSSFRTLPQKNTTLIAGSSMGGLISFFTLLKYPEVFGKAGIFSPAFWTAADSIQAYNLQQASKTSGKVFFYMGGSEGETYINDMQEMADQFGLKTSGTAYSVIDANGKHNEAAWRKWFPEFIRWALIDANNYMIQLKD
jgi:predicted alpha/beta superfamily hydrolase